MSVSASVTALCAWLMTAYGALLVYDCGLQVFRVGPSLRNLSLAALGAAFWALDLPLALQAGIPAVPAAVLTGLAIVFLAGFVAYLIATALFVRRRPRTGWSWVLVLGAGLRQGRYPSPLLRSRLEVGRLWWQLPLTGWQRLDTAALTRTAALSVLPGRPQPHLNEAAAQRAGQARLLVVCGGQGPDERVPEAHAMRDYLVGRGVSAARIVVEDASRTTAENLAGARRLMQAARAAGAGPEPVPGADPDACVIVTNDFHAVRTYLLARQAGLACCAVVGKPTRAYYLVGSLARDYLALLYGAVARRP